MKLFALKHPIQEFLSRALSARSIVAASTLVLSSIALLGPAKSAHAGYWQYTYAGTGKIIRSGAFPGPSESEYFFNKKVDTVGSLFDSPFGNPNPSFSAGNGSYVSTALNPSPLVAAAIGYGDGASASQSVTIDTSATPAIPVVTITATWVPQPTSDVNNDSVINSLDDPAPLTAPTGTLRLHGEFSSVPPMLGGSNSFNSHVKVRASYLDNTSTWIKLSTKDIETPGFPLYNYNQYSDSDTVTTTATANSYSGGVATFIIRVDEFTMIWNGSVAWGDSRGEYRANVQLNFP